METPGLTKRQREILTVIEDFIALQGYSPSLEEIGARMGLSSLATVHVHVRHLAEKGLIRRVWNRGRSIELTPGAGAGQRVRRGVVALPLLGRVAAGAPIEVVEAGETVEVPGEFLRGHETYVLRVHGESMIEEQIRNGDLVIVERRDTAENGETVVALIEGEGATVKRFYREAGDRVRLQPANAAMQPLLVPASACTIQGVVIGLLRKYGPKPTKTGRMEA